MAKEINEVELREAETREEKLLLGFLKQECERVHYGQIVVEFNIQQGRIVHINSNEISRTFKVDARP